MTKTTIIITTTEQQRDSVSNQIAELLLSMQDLNSKLEMSEKVLQQQ